MQRIDKSKILANLSLSGHEIFLKKFEPLFLEMLFADWFSFVLFYLFSIHEKANSIAILWTGSPHSLGSCLFRGLWATCFPHKGVEEVVAHMICHPSETRVRPTFFKVKTIDLVGSSGPHHTWQLKAMF